MRKKRNHEEITRRQFLGIGSKKLIGYGLAATVGGAAGVYLHSLNDDSSPGKDLLKSAGNERSPIDQKNINTLYTALYNDIKQAKKRAENENKKLVILLGEQHDYSLALLNNLMIGDIAARLGIKYAIDENLWMEDKNGNPISSEKKKREIFDTFHQAVTIEIEKNPALNQIPSQDIDLAVTIPYCNVMVKPQGPHALILEDLFIAHKLTLINGDPLRDKITDSTDRRDKRLEEGMAESIRSVDEHRIARYGGAHLPILYDALAKDRSVSLLAFDTSNLDLDVSARQEKKYKERIDLLKQYTKAGKIKKLVVDGKPPSNQEVYKMVMTASFQHRATAKGDIPDKLDPNSAERLEGLLERAYEDCQRQMGAQAGRN